MTGSLQIKKGYYYAVLNIADKEGRVHQKWIASGLPIKNNKRRAEEFLRKAISDSEKQHTLFTEKIMFTDYLQEWLTAMKPAVRANTYKYYCLVVNHHITPYFKPLRLSLDKVEPRHIQGYYNMLLEKGLSANTVLKHHSNIHKALKYACALQLIAYNPSDNVMLPKKTRYIASYYNVEQLNELLRVVQGDTLETVIRLTALYGFRRSEVCGLKWSAVDFHQKTLTVRRAAVMVGTKLECVDKTKTASSYRTLPLTAEMAQYLRTLKAQQEDAQKLIGMSCEEDGYVCCWPDGSPLKPEYVSRRFDKLLRENGLPKIRFHDLRHSAASLLSELGFSLKDIQEWLGHSDIATTANIYSNLQYKSKVEMAEKAGSILGKCGA